MKYLILSLLVISMSAFSADKASKSTAATSSKMTKSTDKKTTNLEGTTDKEVVTDETALVTDQNDFKMHVSCKAKDGHELKEGDEGYEACLKKVKHGKKSSKNPAADVKVKLDK